MGRIIYVVVQTATAGEGCVVRLDNEGNGLDGIHFPFGENPAWCWTSSCLHKSAKTAASTTAWPMR
jgi:hypothetical protein